MGSQKRGGKWVWVIHRQYLGVDRYWTGTVKDHDHRGWVTDPNQAIHFDNPAEPRRVIRIHLENTGNVKPIRVW